MDKRRRRIQNPCIGATPCEMDDRIQEKTQGNENLRDGIRGLLAWSAKNQRALEVEEIPKIIAESTSVDVRT